MTPFASHGREALEALADLLQAKRPPIELRHRSISAYLSLLAEIEQAECRLQIGDGKAFTRMPK